MVHIIIYHNPSDRFDGNLFTFINEDGKEETLEKAIHAKNYM